MKGGHNKKSVRVEFVMSEPEAELVKERMAELGITNLSAYLRKMAVDGYIIHLDMGDIQEMIRLLRICSNNLNQYTRRANETGNIYAADIDDIRTRLDSLWDGMDKLIRGFANISSILLLFISVADRIDIFSNPADCAIHLDFLHNWKSEKAISC